MIASLDLFLGKRSIVQTALLAFGLGFISALSFPPFNLIVLLFVGFSGLYMLLWRASSGWQAFLLGWSFSFGFLTLSLYWIAGALFVDIRSFWWALPFALLGLPACFSLYYGLAASLSYRVGLNKLYGLLVFTLCWFAADMARANLFTGFPWDIVGYAWSDVLPILQSVFFIRIEGLTLLTIMLAVVPASFLLTSRKNASLFCLGGAVVLLLVAGFGVWRLNTVKVEMVPDVRLRLVQPNIDQAIKWKSERRFSNFQKLLSLSFSSQGEKPITHYIWPETATAYYLSEEPVIRQRIAERMSEKSFLITGTVRRQEDTEKGIYNFYNSLIALDAKGSVVAGYDKFHLVPFGEYMPFRSLLPFDTIAGMGNDFTAGPGPTTIRVAGGLPPFSGLVCYEAIFAGDVVEKTDSPQLLLNVTNDAWYEGTIGPAQHFAISRVRAIEEGLPLIRVANKGVTAVVDPLGRVIARLEADEEGFVDSGLPKPHINFN